MEKEILNMEEAAELFGVSVKTFIKLLKEEKVPARKIGREWRFSRKALVEWLSCGDSQAYSSSEGETKEFFNEVASEWEEMRKSYYDESIKGKLEELDILERHMTVIDLGAGDGYISRSIAGSVKKVIAVDISSEMLNELKRKANLEEIENIETLETDGLDIPIDKSSVDVVCANMFLHHIEEPALAIKEMYRILKPGGTVFLADFYEHVDFAMKEKMHDVWAGFNPTELKTWVEKSGFKDVCIERLSDKIEKLKNKNKLEVSTFILTAVK